MAPLSHHYSNSTTLTPGFHHLSPKQAIATPSKPVSLPQASAALPTHNLFCNSQRTILLKYGSDHSTPLIKNLKTFPGPTDKIQTTQHDIQSTLESEPNLSVRYVLCPLNNDNQITCGFLKKPYPFSGFSFIPLICSFQFSHCCGESYDLLCLPLGFLKYPIC